MQKFFRFNSNPALMVIMKTEIYCWHMSKLAHSVFSQKIFPPLSMNILSYFLPITFFLFHEQQMCHFYHSPAGGLLEDD